MVENRNIRFEMGKLSSFGRVCQKLPRFHPSLNTSFITIELIYLVSIQMIIPAAVAFGIHMRKETSL